MATVVHIKNQSKWAMLGAALGGGISRGVEKELNEQYKIETAVELQQRKAKFDKEQQAARDKKSASLLEWKTGLEAERSAAKLGKASTQVIEGLSSEVNAADQEWKASLTLGQREAIQKQENFDATLAFKEKELGQKWKAGLAKGKAKDPRSAGQKQEDRAVEDRMLLAVGKVDPNKMPAARVGFSTIDNALDIAQKSKFERNQNLVSGASSDLSDALGKAEINVLRQLKASILTEDGQILTEAEINKATAHIGNIMNQIYIKGGSGIGTPSEKKQRSNLAKVIATNSLQDALLASSLQDKIIDTPTFMRLITEDLKDKRGTMTAAEASEALVIGLTIFSKAGQKPDAGGVAELLDYLMVPPVEKATKKEKGGLFELLGSNLEHRISPEGMQNQRVKSEIKTNAKAYASRLVSSNGNNPDLIAKAIATLPIEQQEEIMLFVPDLIALNGQAANYFGA
jgi:hypothetical protein